MIQTSKVIRLSNQLNEEDPILEEEEEGVSIHVEDTLRRLNKRYLCW